MLKLAKTLIAGTALLTLTALPVCAAESADYEADLIGGTTEVLNGQVNLNTIWAKVDAKVEDVGEDFGAVTTAVGSTAQIFTLSDTFVINDQSNDAFIGAQTDVEVNGVGGFVGIGATALCNGASISTDPHSTVVDSRQFCGGADPTANINASVSNVMGGVGIQGAAVGNQLQVDSNAKYFPVNNLQINSAPIQSNVNAFISHVGGPASVTATAVGNTAQIIHY